MQKIRIVGGDDPRSVRLERLAREVVSELNVPAQVEVCPPAAAAVDDSLAPALLIDGELKAAGRVPTRNEIGSWLYPRLPG